MNDELRKRILKNTTVEHTSMIEKSVVFGTKDVIPVNIPLINVGLSGFINGGLTSGVTQIAGDSKHFKSNFALMLAEAYLKKYPEGIIIFYDSEFGTPSEYFINFNINLDNVIHTPVTDIEILKFDINKQLKNLTREDKVIIILDSLGGLASKKEAKDADEQNEAADLVRSKEIKSLFKIITPLLSLKDIPLIVINHVYDTIEKYSKKVVSGGKGGYLAADTIWIIGRQQELEEKTKELTGFNFIINVEKSRFVREKSKIPISVSFDYGIYKWSGLLDLAVEAGMIESSGGWFKIKNKEGQWKSVRAKEFRDDDAFWEDLLKNGLGKFIEEKYRLPYFNEEEVVTCD